MEKIEITKRDLIFIGILSVIAAIFTIIWMAMTGNAPQIYNDIVIEWTVWVRSNKSAEITLLRLLIVIGSIAVFCWCKFGQEKIAQVTDEQRNIAAKYFVSWICSILVLKFLFFMQISQIFVFSLCFAVIAFIIEKGTVVPTLCLYFLSYYSFFAIYQTCNFLGSYGIIKIFSNIGNYSPAFAVFFAILCTSVSLFFKNRIVILKKAILILQIIIPALFLILSIKKYNYHGQTDIIGIPLQAKFFIVLMIVACSLLAVKNLKKSWNQASFEISDIISIGTCISIMCFNFYNGSGAVVNNDPHHPFENVFAFQQIFELGQIPYKDFIPPSGLYSVIEGAFFKLFGNGNIAYYNLANNIFFYTCIAVTLILLQFHLKKIWCFAIVLFLQFPNYNRTVFMTLIILLLLLPKLVQCANLWLKVFILVSLFHSLYYPVYGVACAVGFLPMFIVQVKNVVTDESKPYRAVKFWIGWAVVFAVLLVSIPLLWGTFVHILAMSGQSVLADGISIFGQELPSWFMPYARNLFRYPVYNAMHIIPLALMVWLSVWFLCKILSAVKENNGTWINFFEEHIELFTMVVSLILIPLVSYTFSFIRVDMFTFFARSWSALICVFVLYTIFIVKYIRANAFKLFSLLLLNLFIVSSFGIGVDTTGNKMFSMINVPDNYVLVENDEFDYDTVGKCFLDSGMRNNIYYMIGRLSEVDESNPFGMGTFGQYYIPKQKGGANIEAGIMKSFGAAKETRNMLIKNKVAANSVTPLELYYLYNWLVASGEYIWDEEQKLFVPNENILDYEEVKKRNKIAFSIDNYGLGNSADVFGLSFKSLRKIFTEKEIPYKTHKEDRKLVIDLSDNIYGNDMDFIYIEFTEIENDYMTTSFNMAGEHEEGVSKLISRLFLKKKTNPSMFISVWFYDENGERHSVSTSYGNGKLLINLGVGMKYLLENHNRFEITAYNGWDNDWNLIPTDLPNLKEIKFLKCRQIY